MAIIIDNVNSTLKNDLERTIKKHEKISIAAAYSPARTSVTSSSPDRNEKTAVPGSEKIFNKTVSAAGTSAAIRPKENQSADFGSLKKPGA